MAVIFIIIVMMSICIVNGNNHPVNDSSQLVLSINDNLDFGYVNVKLSPYNAKGDGVTDDANAIQQALNDIGAVGGGVVFVPEGNYLIATHLIVPTSTVLKGVATHVHNDWGDPSQKRVSGTTLLAIADAGNEIGTPFISLFTNSSGVEGLQIFYPNQVPRNPPIPYPWTIRCGRNGTITSIQNTFVKNVMLVNSWKGIDAATHAASRHWFENVYGQPLSVGIAIDQCRDIGRIMHVHFWPFWSQEPALLDWVNNNGVAFIIEQTDWEVVEDVFSWGYQTGMVFRKSIHGACNGQFRDINFDQVDIGIDISHTQLFGIFFTNLNLANAGGGSNRIGILGHRVNISTTVDALVDIRGASFWGQFEQNIVWSHRGLISISDSLFIAWNQTKPCIEIQRGRAMINNNYFKDKIGNAITVSDNADHVTVTNNQLTGNTLNIVSKPTILVANNLR
jgi:hypothetical protein